MGCDVTVMSFYMLSCRYVTHTGLPEPAWEAWLMKRMAFALMHNERVCEQLQTH